MSDSEDEVMLQAALFTYNNLLGTSSLVENPAMFGLQNEAERNQNFYEQIVPRYSDEEFRQHFRMSRECFEDLLLRAHNANVQNIRKKLLFTIWMLSKQESFLSAGDRFNFARSSGHVAFCEILAIIISLGPDLIKWPSTEEYESISESFKQKTGGKIPGVIGGIDGCHIQIKQPIGNPIDYFNRKNTHSIILQGVCDHRAVFTDIYVGALGRLHDARVFRNSVLSEKLHDIIPYDYHFLGDAAAAYPLLQNLQTPIRDSGHLTAVQKRFNTSLSSGRVVIERAFGLLKGRFRRLKYIDSDTPEMAVKIVVASVILHNHIMLFQEDPRINDFLDNDESSQPQNDESQPVPSATTETSNSRGGQLKRRHLLSFFGSQS